MKLRGLSICLLMILCLFITGCGEEKTRDVATLDEFTNVASSKGFTVNDNMELYSEASYILEAKQAIYDDITIEMVKYTDSDYANKAQENHIESFDLLKTTGASAHKEKGSNYYSYSLVSNNRYMISTRVDNTLIFCKVMLSDKETVDGILDELGY